MPLPLPIEPRASNDQLGGRLVSLRPGHLLTVIGISCRELAERLPPTAPRLLQLDLAGLASHTEAISRIIDDLATSALQTWPDWPEPLVRSWARVAGRLASAGRAPRFRHVALETQFHELAAAAGTPALLFPLDAIREEFAAPMIAALEWCRRHGTAVVALLSEAPPCEAPWDRILHGALTLAHTPLPVAARLVVPASASTPRGSVIEKRMREALAADPELSGLFEDEVTLRLSQLGPTPRVDLLWRDGKVVVELDGAEHERDPNYGADRHRDYELLVAGYLVLRLTNAEVALDLGRSIDKVRSIVNLRRSA